ncbi:hypothetical protein R3P38DRAFT_2845560 [Favolaschia claudopus]|uniref:Uncharacterized protein n=1 Tax=Favolaschia claudopus TaxID=2862362 RepID=A0AAW0DTW0_9AGAR
MLISHLLPFFLLSGYLETDFFRCVTESISLYNRSPSPVYYAHKVRVASLALLLTALSGQRPALRLDVFLIHSLAFSPIGARSPNLIDADRPGAPTQSCARVNQSCPFTEGRIPAPYVRRKYALSTKKKVGAASQKRAFRFSE